LKESVLLFSVKRLANSDIPRDYIPFHFHLQIKTDPIFEATRYADTPDGKR
jgi:hypothetical protein